MNGDFSPSATLPMGLCLEERLALWLWARDGFLARDSGPRWPFCTPAPRLLTVAGFPLSPLIPGAGGTSAPKQLTFIEHLSCVDPR